MIRKIDSQRGFSMIELIIVIFIMGILSTALVMNFRAGDRQRRVNLMRDVIISSLRTAQNSALSGKQIPPGATFVRGNSRCLNDNAALSYWVEFTTSNNIDLMAEDRCGAIMRVQRFDGVPQTRFLTSNPFSLTTSGTTSSTTIAIRFTPPFGVITATTTSTPLPGAFNAFVSSNLSVEYQDGQRTRTIVVDGISGRID
jgi:prepilin-type N-terminal cleavage/methylation domain-containing protein